MNYSLVVKGGDSGYACYTNGNNMVFLPREVPGGCADRWYPLPNFPFPADATSRARGVDGE
jgi:hypothetical protein